MTEGKRILTIQEAADYLRISTTGVGRFLDRGELIAVKVGKRTLFARADLDAFIEERRRVKREGAWVHPAEVSTTISAEALFENARRLYNESRAERAYGKRLEATL